jgi:hypothetical protein
MGHSVLTDDVDLISHYNPSIARIYYKIDQAWIDTHPVSKVDISKHKYAVIGDGTAIYNKKTLLS